MKTKNNNNKIEDYIQLVGIYSFVINNYIKEGFLSVDGNTIKKLNYHLDEMKKLIKEMENYEM